MQVTNKIRNKTKLLQLILTSAPTYLNAKTYKVFITNNCTNTSFFYLSSSITRILILASQNLNEKQIYLIKKNRCFSYKEKRHTTYNYSKKEKNYKYFRGY